MRMVPAPSPLPHTEPPRDCPLCPRLVAFREACRLEHRDWWNAPVPAFGDPQAWLAIVGLAPGKAFGPGGGNFLRACFLRNPAHIADAAERLSQYVKAL